MLALSWNRTYANSIIKTIHYMLSIAVSIVLPAVLNLPDCSNPAIHIRNLVVILLYHEFWCTPIPYTYLSNILYNAYV